MKIRCLPLLATLVLGALSVAPQTASATKTVPMLPGTITTVQTVYPNGTFDYVLTVPNNSKFTYVKVDVIAHFPAEAKCTQIVSASLPGCMMAKNSEGRDKIACWYNTHAANTTLKATVRCQLDPKAVCGSKPRAVMNVYTRSPQKGATTSETSFTVACQATPTPTPQNTATAVPTNTPPVHPTYVPTPIPTNTPVVVHPTATPVSTSTPIPTATATSVPVHTATPHPSVTATPTPAAGACESYSILRRVKGSYPRDLATIRENVISLPAGDKLSCFLQIMRGNSAPLIKYLNFTHSDPILPRELRQDSAVEGAYFGMSELTYVLLQQFCSVVGQNCEECEQFEALSLIRSDAMPLPRSPSGVVLGREHNPRLQQIVMDKNCQVVVNPTIEQLEKSCPAAYIDVVMYGTTRVCSGKCS
jgi:hypothetical protein